MNGRDEIKIVTPDMRVESGLFDDVLSANISVLVFRGYIPPVMSQDLVSDLEHCSKLIRVSSYLNAKLTTLGPYFVKYISSPEEYFKQVAEIQAVLPGSLDVMKDNVYRLVREWLQFETFKTAVDPVFGEYSGSIVRFHADGIANPLHNDNISRDAACSGLVVANIVHQLSCVVCLQECTAGGALRVFKKKWNFDDERFKNKCELGYSDDVVSGYGFCEFSPCRGDIYIFNPGYYHEIDCVSGVTRITLGFFFGIAGGDVKTAIAWS